MNVSEMESKVEMDADRVMEMKDVKELYVQLDDSTSLNLMGLMDAMGIGDTGEVVREIIKRTHNREKDLRPWKQRVIDRREQLQNEVDNIDKKLKKIEKSPMWKKLVLLKKISTLKKEKKLLKARLKEQLRTYRMVFKIE